jgi:hypothetical protein
MQSSSLKCIEKTTQSFNVDKTQNITCVKWGPSENVKVSMFVRAPFHLLQETPPWISKSKIFGFLQII